MADAVVSDGLGVRIELQGMAETILALEQVDPDVVKYLKRRLTSVGQVVAGTASRRAPVGRTRKMRSGYRTSTRSYSKRVVTIVRNDTPQANILEFAGSRSSGNPGPIKVTRGPRAGTYRKGSGPQLIRTLDNEYGKPGRFLWDSYDALEPWIVDQVDAAGREAEAALEARLPGGEG